MTDSFERPMSDRARPSRPASSWPETQSTLRRNAWMRWPLLLVGLLCGPLTVVLITVFDRPGAHGIARLGAASAQVTGLVFVFGTMFGGIFIWINRRRRKAVRRHPWTIWPIRYISTGRYEWVELIGPDGVPVSTLILNTWARDIGKLVNHRTSEIWFAGDPTKYGVVSRPGGGDLRYAYFSRSRQPPRFTFESDDASSRLTRRESATADRRSPTQHQLTREGDHLAMRPDTKERPTRHGASNDTRYPSPRMLRRTLAFTLDWAWHFGSAAAVLVAGNHRVPAITLVALGVWVATSFADRVVLQGLFHTTVGKALFGLCVIRPDNGEFPSFARLTKVWFVDLYISVLLPLAIFGGDGPGPDNLSDYFLPAVRRRDLRPQAVVY